MHPFLLSIRYGLVVRIAGSHPAGPGSIPGNGMFLTAWELFVALIFPEFAE
jgi:hypothetical protein